MNEILSLFLFYLPIIVKTNIVHLVFVAIHEQEISASSAEPFRGDSQLHLSIKLLTYCLPLNITQYKLYRILMQ